MIYDEQEANEAEELHAVVEAVKDALANHLKGSVTITQVEETDRGVEADWLRKHDFTEGGPGVFSKTYPGKTTFEELSVKQQGLYKLLMRYLEKTHPGAMAQKRPEPA
jgi:hypothetical protein